MLRQFSHLFALLLLLMSLIACTPSVSKPYVPITSTKQTSPSKSHSATPINSFSNEIQGKASWYALTAHGTRTASGEVYDLYGLTAAHASLPFSTPLRVTHLQTGRQVIVTVNDRLSEPNLVVKLSYQAAQQIGLLTYPSSQVIIQSLPRNLLFPSRSEKRE